MTLAATPTALLNASELKQAAWTPSSGGNYGIITRTD
jgi:hypothetical protein